MTSLVLRRCGCMSLPLYSRTSVMTQLARATSGSAASGRSVAEAPNDTTDEIAHELTDVPGPPPVVLVGLTHLLVQTPVIAALVGTRAVVVVAVAGLRRTAAGGGHRTEIANARTVSAFLASVIVVVLVVAAVVAITTEIRAPEFAAVTVVARRCNWTSTQGDPS